jgi:hypothetical protein
MSVPSDHARDELRARFDAITNVELPAAQLRVHEAQLRGPYDEEHEEALALRDRLMMTQAELGAQLRALGDAKWLRDRHGLIHPDDRC